jgi:Zn-dependent protease with chaperone function
VLVTDYLLDEFGPSDLDAILAHELGHARHHDVIVSEVIASFWSLPASIAVVGLAADDRPFALVMAFIALGVLVGSGQWLRRRSIRQELAADNLAVGIVGPGALASALAHLTELNAIKRDTSLAWDEKVGHPGMTLRIGRLQESTPAVPGEH